LSGGYLRTCAPTTTLTIAAGMTLWGALAAPFYLLVLLERPGLARAYSVVAHALVLLLLGVANAQLIMLDKTGWMLAMAGIFYGPIGYYRQT